MGSGRTRRTRSYTFGFVAHFEFHEVEYMQKDGLQSFLTCVHFVFYHNSVMGLISIPGMMTGQILGGSSIEDAVRYQQVKEP
jgi:hypothetical protein